MKTTKIISVLSIVLIFAVVTSTFGAVTGLKGGPTTNAGIRYTVNIPGSVEKPIAGTYLIKIFNEKNQLVAPAQVYIQGQSQYNFHERGPADGVRIAVLVKAPSNGLIEPFVTLYAEPAVVKGPFEVGKTYRFDLFPKLMGARD